MALATLWRPALQFWPPPKKGSWQDHIFRLLFRALVYCGLVASALWLWQSGWPGGIVPIMGAVLVVLGFGGAFGSTSELGWKNAFGDNKGLITSGLFRFSRNPIYVMTWVGLLGWGLVVQAPLVWTMLGMWALIYVIVTRLEEPWLHRQYGAAYAAYCAKTPRFLLIK
ncbi:MAG: methyltransferase family protein [Maritimibacter sp.]